MKSFVHFDLENSITKCAFLSPPVLVPEDKTLYSSVGQAGETAIFSQCAFGPFYARLEFGPNICVRI